MGSSGSLAAINIRFSAAAFDSVKLLSQRLFERTPLAALLVLVLAAVFGHTALFVQYVWDDPWHILNNSHFFDFFWKGFLDLWREPYLKLYIPLSYTVWGILHALAGHLAVFQTGGIVDASIFHCANILLHIANTLAVLAVLRRLTGDRTAAFLGALLFGVHPVQVESVAWVSELRGLLAWNMSLLSLLLFLSHEEARDRGEAGRWTGWRFWTAFVHFGLALLAKPAAVVLPIALAIISLAFFRRKPKDVCLSLLPWAAPALACMAITVKVQPNVMWVYVPPLWQRILVALDTVTFYLARIVIPVWFSPDYGRPPETALADPLLAVYAAAPLLLASWMLLRRSWTNLACLGLFVTGFLPVSGLVPFDFQAISTVADRYLYFSMLGPSLALAFLLRDKGTRLLRLTIVACLLLMGVVSFEQTNIWRNDATVFAHTVKFNGSSWLGLNNFGQSVDLPPATKAMLYREAVRHKPDGIYGLTSLATALRDALSDPAFDRGAFAGEDKESAGSLREAGVAAAKAGSIREAVRDLGQSIALEPLDSESYRDLGTTFLLLSDPVRAIASLELANTLDPGNPAVENAIGAALFSLGKKKPAITRFRLSLEHGGDSAIVGGNLETALAHENDSSGEPASFVVWFGDSPKAR